MLAAADDSGVVPVLLRQAPRLQPSRDVRFLVLVTADVICCSPIAPAQYIRNGEYNILLWQARFEFTCYHDGGMVL